MSAPSTPEALLAAPEICVLATAGPGGKVHAMPMWFLYEDATIWFLTPTGSQKYNNVRRTGQATVTLDLREPPYYAIMIQGHATAGENPDPALQHRLVSRYIGEERAARYVDTLIERGRNGYIAVTPEKTVEFHGTT